MRLDPLRAAPDAPRAGCPAGLRDGPDPGICFFAADPEPFGAGRRYPGSTAGSRRSEAALPAAEVRT